MSSARFVITAATAADADQLAEIQNRGWQDAYASLLPAAFYDEEALERRRTHWLRTLTTPLSNDVHLAVARPAPGLAPVGFAWAGPARDEAAPASLELFALYILSDWYGSGIAAALTNEVLGNDATSLWVADPNPRAQAFYRKIGFEPDGAVTVDDALDGLREIRMVRG